METTGAETMLKSQAVMAGQREFIFPAVKALYDEPVVIAEAEGVRVRDVDGKEYLDLFGGILTTSVGHCNPKVVARSQEQMARLGHTSTLYVTEPQVEAAQRLADIAPGQLSQTFFTNSGTEAIETAIHMACLHTDRTEIIALRQAYHGRSFLASNITAVSSWRPMASTFPGIKHTITPYEYRCPFKQPCDESCTDAFINDLEDVIRTTTNGRPAAFIVESIMGVGGYIVPPPRYLERAAEVIRSHGGLFISDEVQSGFGRSGGRWFAIEHAGVEPDIMVMAKGIANGMPVGATITTPDIAASWKAKTISTFGGSPVSMAAMAATLEVMVDEDVPQRARERGGQLYSGLMELYARFRWIGEIRGMGLMQAMELVEDPDIKEPSPQKTKALLEAAKAEGLLIGVGGLHGHVIRLGPSLLITEAEMDEGLERLGKACQRVEAASVG
jgi:alanine-glyoxylate transaminase/(R)-3-amino-2-methylpropionate-pyruvate transaminase